MSIMAILEVALGMIFAWLVLSVAVMYIQEWMVGRMAWRSEMLESYISNLVADPSLARQFYDHPLIQGLHSGSDGQSKPAYIPAAQFSMALLDIITNMPKESSLVQKVLYDLDKEIDRLGWGKKKSARLQLNQTLVLARKAVSSQGDAASITVMLDAVKRGIRTLYDDHPALRRAIRARIHEYLAQKEQIDGILAGMRAKNDGNPDETPEGQLKEGMAAMSIVQPEFKQAIEALTNGVDAASSQGEGFLDGVRKNLEDWFNNAMDRLTGWYKRRAQTLAFMIALAVGVMLNIDSLQIATQLWRDPAVREALTAQASAFANANPDPSVVATPDAQKMAAIALQISQLNVPLGWIGTAMPMDASGMVIIGDAAEKVCNFSAQSDAELFGIRWGSECHPIINTPLFNDPTGWLLKLIGLFITGAAAAQGAPFWFDILKKVVNVRANGINSDEAALKAGN